MTQSDRPISKLDIFRDAIDRFQRELDLRGKSDAVPAAEAEESEGPSIAVPLDPVILAALSDWAPIVARLPKGGNPVSAYVECLQSLCDTTGGRWIDDDPNRLAGCYFRTNLEAAGYAVLVWTCLPGGFLRYVFA